jgi:anthranilate synthase component I
VPDMCLMLATDLVVLDHYTGSATLVANAILPEGADERQAASCYHQAIGRLDAMTTALSRPNPPMVSTVDPAAGRSYATSRTLEGEYPKAVESAIEAIRAGECFQIVVGQRFERRTEADPLDIYRVLRTTNPSPYMYLLRFDGFDIVGSSPEVHLKVTGRRALLHPIAGTRPRGGTLEQDAQLAADLLADPKERAEHVMLVDLGRNDLGRVCRPGSVQVPELMKIERYSHVMHIASVVTGELADGRSALDALAATFPAGTLSGAPKVRAMEIIEELETSRRGPYAGAIGYVDYSGNLDSCITIRTTVLARGVAHVQAGAGIVADSVPQQEYRECVSKAGALIDAIERAEARA